MAKAKTKTRTKTKTAKTARRTPGGKKPARGGRRPGPRGAQKPAQRGKERMPKTAIRPKRGAAPVAPAGPALPDTGRPTAVAIAKAGLDKKAEDVLVLDVRGLTGYADYFVLMTADSDRQASAIADHVEQSMKTAGVSKVGVEGYETGRWILIDYGDVVAHVMNKESRGFYDLESLWADAPRFAVEG